MQVRTSRILHSAGRPICGVDDPLIINLIIIIVLFLI